MDNTRCSKNYFYTFINSAKEKKTDKNIQLRFYIFNKEINNKTLQPRAPLSHTTNRVSKSFSTPWRIGESTISMAALIQLFTSSVSRIRNRKSMFSIYHHKKKDQSHDIWRSKRPWYWTSSINRSLSRVHLNKK